MKRTPNIILAPLIALAVAAAFPEAARSADEVAGLKEEVERLNEEVQQLRALVGEQGSAGAPTEAAEATARESSEAVTTQSDGDSPPPPNSRVNLAGYGHVGFARGQREPLNRDTFSEVGFNPIFQYQYKDLLLFETELEIEVDEEGEAEFGLEYANMNFFVNDYVTVFGGKFLSPVGYFIQNLHPAWINKFPSKPPGFQEEGGAAPVSDVGMGVRGGFPLGATKANYALYVGNGPRLELNEAGDEIESIVATGATVNLSNENLVGGRFGLLPIPHLEVGVSGATSRVAAVDEETGAVEPDRSYDVVGADFAYKWKALDFRGEYIQTKVGGPASGEAPAGGTWKTWYLQAAYRIPSTKWEPAVRFAKYTSPIEGQSEKQRAVSFDYWFEPNIVGKIAYEFNSGEPGTVNDIDLLLLQFAYGF